MSTQPLLLYDPLLFLLIYLNHISLHKTLYISMYITMCLYILLLPILLWVLSIYPFIKHYTIVVSHMTIQFSYINIISIHLLLYRSRTEAKGYMYSQLWKNPSYHSRIHVNRSKFYIWFSLPSCWVITYMYTSFLH